ncbi:Protein N-acetyltransferase, RimJ/RimL family [Plantibacter flavus]|uniref:RimJ/RimL family protein N-acetyltransferase n=1 Tax=Plantibacter flavus TaxID=150123 RepID=A0A3N2BZ50_9MICO|nr:GNAT family N-acetyltransferase [Plantibacter flavus]ROR80324.1 RimJ/RimL family protein N-acetyltransferase [Plantibacter flavus]SMG35308.1 Protein N-acetyltransferase, RimJ/RimL family [Plantibacter flavus]
MHDATDSDECDARFMPWPVIEPLVSERVTLEPLSLDHARPMVDVLSDPALHTFTGGEPPTLDTLSTRFAAQIRGPADGSQAWFNWIVRRHDTGALVGFVQATGESQGQDMLAEIAWVIDPAHQHQGFASEATASMIGWLHAQGVTRLTAHIHPEHTVSQRVAHRRGLRPTSSIEDGEVRWESPISSPTRTVTPPGR